MNSTSTSSDANVVNSTSTLPASNLANSSIATTTPTPTPTPTPAATGTSEWRNKDDDRAARQHIARLILSLIMKSSNRPVANYNPREIARRLEHTLYMSASSKEEYANVATLKQRLQQALDNSRRRQMQQQQQLQAAQQQNASLAAATAASATAAAAAAAAQTMSITAQQQLQAHQLLQQQRQQQLRMQLQQRAASNLLQTNLQQVQATAIPAPPNLDSLTPPTTTPVSVVAAVPVPMPASVSTPAAPTPAPSSTSTPTPVSAMTTTSTGNSILDELEREADEMACEVSDKPIAMPESELQAKEPATSGSLASTGTTPTTVSPAVVSSTPISMPPEISANVSTVPSPVVDSAIQMSAPMVNTTTLGMVASNAAAVVAPSIAVAASAPVVASTTLTTPVTATTTAANLYHGMNVSGAHIQQIQLQQMQQLRRMQQLQQLQQQQAKLANNSNLVANPVVTSLPVSVVNSTIPTSSTAVTTPATAATAIGSTVGAATTTAAATAATTPTVNEASIAQKREELKRRLIQLKHARTCASTDCSVEYCSRIKMLLAHVSRCANAQCTTIGCKSTRQLLSHFRKCRNLQCDVCSAIRPPMNESEQQLVLRRQQERLCMLRHASTCTVTPCVLPYCASMKVLWKHICECHQRQCRTDHCISSRYVLSHFKQCSKMICEVCGPVRKAIKIIDSCKGNPAQLQLTVSQSPDAVRGLVKIMNTIALGPAAAAAVAATASQAAQNKINASSALSTTAATAAAVAAPTSIAAVAQQRQAAATSWMAAQLQNKSNAAAAAAAAAAMEAAKQAAVGNAGATATAVGTIAVTPSVTTPTPVPAVPEDVTKKDPSVATTITVAAAAAAAAASPAVPTTKKKPLRMQSEKEKKIRRKEQARLAKARTQAKAHAAGKTLPGGLSLPSAPHGISAASVAATTALTKAEKPVQLTHHDISFLDSMTEEQLEEHIRSLRFNFCGHITLTELRNRLMPLLTKLMDSEYGWAFNSPVDPVQWNIPDYFDVIKCPMDLGTIKKKLENEHYNSVEAFAGDVRLVFENCIAYNHSSNKFNMAAKQLLNSFEKSLSSFKVQLEKQLFKRCEQRREEMCQLCGGESFKFAPCMLFCSGPCAGRIRRHTHYYSDPRGEHHWCSSCYKQMKDGPIDMSLLPPISGAVTDGPGAGGAAGGDSDGVLKKSSLLKRKNSEVAEEPWVECDSCKLWYHQICALFNERNHAISGEQEPFVCPICVKKQRQAGVKPSLENGLKARRLPITRMSRVIENRVLRSLQEAKEEEAKRLEELGNMDSVGFTHSKGDSNSKFGVTIREVLCVEKQVQIKPKMGRLLAAKYSQRKTCNRTAGTNSSNSLEKSGNSTGRSLKRKRASSTEKKSGAANGTNTPDLLLTYRSRCICVFQELDGVDVLIFTLYIQEYGPNSLEPNAGRVYVSYLDSVNYFQPKKWRTLMHQQVMLGFLEDCKNRGYHTAHIWSCPPLKGDDYIFFCKPENQKIPKAARLRSWYQKLLTMAKQEGLVVNISNLYAEYYLKKKAAHELPYFEGDYWPRLAEDLIKQLEEKTVPSTSRSGDPTSSTALGTSTKGDSAAGSASSQNASSNDPKAQTVAETPAMSPTGSDASIENGDDGLSSSMASADISSATKSKTGNKMKKRSKKKRVVAPSAPMATQAAPPGDPSKSSCSLSTRSKKKQLAGGKNANTKAAVNPDPLMQKLKGILEPQKDDFFVVDLFPRCHKCSQSIIHKPYWQLKTVQPSAAVMELIDAARKNKSISSSRHALPRHYHHYYCLSCFESNKTQLQHRVDASTIGARKAVEVSSRLLPLNEKSAVSQLAQVDFQEIKYELNLSYVDPSKKEEKTPSVKKEHSHDKPMKTKGSALKSSSGGTTAVAVPKQGVKEEKKEASESGTTEKATTSAAETAVSVKTEVTVKEEPEAGENKQAEGDAASTNNATALANSNDSSSTSAPTPNPGTAPNLTTQSAAVAPSTSATASNLPKEGAASTQEHEKENQKHATVKKEEQKVKKEHTTSKSKSRSKLKASKTSGDEPDVIMPCEIFDTREAFLLYCQNNHCQFDQIRRAKHSSMMVLYHLFNQGTTGFTFSCSSCKITLLSGNRWNCSICTAFNLCDNCHMKIKHEHTLHSFKVVAIPRPGVGGGKAEPQLTQTPSVTGAVPVAPPTIQEIMPTSRPPKVAKTKSSLKAKKAALAAAHAAHAANSGTKSTTSTSGRKRKLNAIDTTVIPTTTLPAAPTTTLPATSSSSNGIVAPPTVTMASTAGVSVPKSSALPTAPVSAPITTPASSAAVSAPPNATPLNSSTSPSKASLPVSGATTDSTSATTAGLSVASALTSAVSSTGMASPALAPSADSSASASGTPTNSADASKQKQRRIHNIDPQLLLQLEHASGCTQADCTFFNCQRMRSMLKHGAICEQRLSGPCVLCKRIVGLLSAHARQCQKEYNECKVPRCADIRRHFMLQLQQRRQEQQAAVAAAAAAAAAAQQQPDSNLS